MQPCALGLHAQEDVMACVGLCSCSFLRFGMERGLVDYIIPVLSSIGVASLLAPRSPPTAPPAIVFCDCPAVAHWAAGGFVVGLIVGVTLVCVGAALLRPPILPRAARAESQSAFHDALEVLSPPAAAYRPWRRPGF